MKFFDAHTHVHFAGFDEDYRDVIARAVATNVMMITVGTQIDTSRRAVLVAHEFPEDIWAAVGLHPVHTEASYHDEKELGGGEAAKSFASRGETFDYNAYKKLAQNPKVVAIGECGLDYYRLSEETKGKQTEALRAQVELAYEVGKPLMIHCRNAFPDLIEFLKANNSHLKAQNPGVIHFMTGTKRDAEELLALGFGFTFGGVVTFPPKADKHAGDYDEVVRAIPPDHILSETDAPYVAPVPYRGKRNEPAYVVEVVKKLAELKGMAPDEMRDQIFRNAKRIFGIG